MDCLLCGTILTQRGASFSYVKTYAFVQTILERCGSRPDEWAFTVRGRIEYYGCDLHAAHCIYRRSCSGHFRSGLNTALEIKNLPEAKGRKSGRPKDVDREQASVSVCSYFENNDEEQLTLSHVGEKMKDFFDKCRFSTMYMESSTSKEH